MTAPSDQPLPSFGPEDPRTCEQRLADLRQIYKQVGNINPETFPANAWALWSGTSFAAPQVAGAIARIAQEQGTTPREALRRLLDGQPSIPDYGRAVEILPRT